MTNVLIPQEASIQRKPVLIEARHIRERLWFVLVVNGTATHAFRTWPEAYREQRAALQELQQ